MKKSWIIVFVLWILFPCKANAEQADIIEKATQKVTQNEVQDTLLSQFSFDEIDEILQDIFPNGKVRFGETVIGLLSGKVEFSLELLGKLISDCFFYEVRSSKEGLIHVLLIVIVAAVFTNFSGVFQNSQISEISFFVLYLLLITISLKGFQILAESVGGHMEQLTVFMKLLGPVYFLSVTLASGSATSIAFYNLVLLLIYLVELLILHFLLPLVQVFIMIRILNHLSSEEYLSKLADLLQTVIAWTLKTLLAGVVGLNVIQGLLTPAIDSLKRSVLTKGAEAIPIIGDALGGTAEVVFGTAVLIKNGIGVAGMILCAAICLPPIVQMAVITLMYKLTAAMIQPISDKRIVGCISSIADGTHLLLKVVFTVGVLFLLTIAVVASTTTS